MESGTAERARRRPMRTNGIERVATAAATGSRSSTRRPERLVESIEVDSPEAIAATVARIRSNQAEWEALGIEGRYHWLGKLRDWMLDNTERIADTMQAETGKVRGDISDRTLLRRRPDQLLREERGQVHRRRRRCGPTRRCSPRRSW